MPTPRLCADCGTPTLSTRCPPCASQRERARQANRPHLAGNWDATSRRIRKDWVDMHGWVCPGWQRPPHPSRDLTVDHVAARSAARLQVLCRSCNSRKSVTERPTTQG
jgi:hypothetical protein